MPLLPKLLSAALAISLILAAPGAVLLYEAARQIIDEQALASRIEELSRLTALTAAVQREALARTEARADAALLDGAVAETDRLLRTFRRREQLFDPAALRRLRAAPADDAAARFSVASGYAKLSAALITRAADQAALSTPLTELDFWSALLRLRHHLGWERIYLELTGAQGSGPLSDAQWAYLGGRRDALLGAAVALAPTAELALAVASLRHGAFAPWSGAESGEVLAAWREHAAAGLAAIAGIERQLLARLEAGQRGRLDKASAHFVAVLGLGLLAALLVALYARSLRRSVTQPLGTLFAAVERLRREPQAAPRLAVPRRAGEMAGLIDSFNRMVEARQASEREHLLAKSVFDHALEGIVVTDPAGVIRSVNPALCRMLGSDAAALAERDVSIFESFLHKPEVSRAMRRTLAETGEWRGELWNGRSDGRLVLVRLSLSAVRDADGRVQHYIGIYSDITEQRRTEEALRQAHAYHRLVMDALGEGVYTVGAEGDLRYANPAARELLGLERGELAGWNAYETFLPEHGAERAMARDKHPLYDVIHSGTPFRGETVFVRRDGARFPVQCNSTPIVEAGRIVGAVVVFQDITLRREAERRIQYLAYHDCLTGLANRAFLVEHLPPLLAHCHRQGLSLAVLFMDLDRFKRVNDTLGHHLGDQLLVEVAARLREVLREEDLLVRQGGDEFIAVLPGVALRLGQARVRAAAVAAAEKIQHALASPFQVEGHEVAVAASIGVACFPDHGEDTVTLLRHADQAMYRAKADRVSHFVYRKEDRSREGDLLAMESRMRRALLDGEFELHVQPVIDLAGCGVSGGEALLRWRDGDRLVAPGEFIGLAEETGLIIPLGAWVLKEAMGHAARWRTQMPEFRLAINLSPRQLQSRGLLRTIFGELQAAGLDPQAVELEITETVTMSLPRQSRRVLRLLKRRGLRLAIDDFGIGHSSLLRLQELTADRLKIDRMFVKDLPASEQSMTIVRNTITLAHELGMAVVAEGVETEEQRGILEELGCEFAQGYYFGAPVSTAAFTDLLGSAAKSGA